MIHQLLGLAGAPALLLLCGVLLAEELGLPLPMLPGDALLVGGGVLIGAGRLSWWAYLPATVAAMVVGASGARVWSGRVGPAVLGRVARRVGCEGALLRGTARLRRGGAVAVFVGRNLPGMRVYTNLAAGAAGMRWRSFLPGMVAAVITWVVGFGLLGQLAGTSMVRLLEHAERRVALVAIVVAVTAAVVGGATLLVVRSRRGAAAVPDAGRSAR